MDRSQFFSNGQISFRKLTEEYLKIHYPSAIEEILQYDILNSLRCSSFRQKAYHWVFSLSERPRCSVCNKSIPNERFLDIRKGYIPFCSRECILVTRKKKYKITCKEKYGVDNVAQLETVKRKMADTREIKTGVRHNLQSLSIKEKYKRTCLERYGVDNPWKSEFAIERNKKKNENYIIETLKDLIFKDTYRIEKTDKTHSKSTVIAKCNVCGKEYEITLKSLLYRLRTRMTPCVICNPLYGEGGERYISEYLARLGIKHDVRNRSVISPMEVDILIEDKKLCIEYNGLYRHSELQKDKNYHIKKLQRVTEAGYSLITIWEDDWFKKTDIVKSRLNNVLGKNTQKIYARNCKVIEIDQKTVSDFLNKNHLQGNVNSSVRLALVYNDEIVSVMTFGKLRKMNNSISKEGEWELYRFCNSCFTTVVGSANKLFSYFLKNFKVVKVISYADKCWTSVSGKTVYDKMGFKLEGETGINWWWVIDNERINRFAYRRDVVSKKFGIDADKSSIEKMHEVGFYRVFGSGNFRYVYFK